MKRQFGLIGFPLDHSFSKTYFTEKFERENRKDCSYDTYPISSINQLPALLLNQPDLEGLNVTIPYKKSVLQYLQNADELPFSACNCIKIYAGKCYGYNTDWIGFDKSFSPFLQPRHNKALVLGNGGAAQAVMYVLQKNGISYEVVSRLHHKGSTLLYTELTDDIIAKHTLIINCSPVGTFPHINECPDINYSAITPHHYLFDLVYNPGKTLFLQKGEAAGATIKNGYDMLKFQAEAAWQIWNSL